MDWESGPLIAELLKNTPIIGDQIKGLNSLDLRGNRIKVIILKISKY